MDAILSPTLEQVVAQIAVYTNGVMLYQLLAHHVNHALVTIVASLNAPATVDYAQELSTLGAVNNAPII